MIKQVVCKVCGKQFELESHTTGQFRKFYKPLNTKTCSVECHHKNRLRIASEQRERKKRTIVTKKCRFCGKEVVSSQYCPRSFCGGKAGGCYSKYLSESRKGNNNPAYRNGTAVIGKRTYTGKHLRACKKYRKEFLEKNSYLFCEICGVNNNGTPRFEVHHIYYASLFPKHKELHNQKNLILLCIGCHNDMHSGKMRSGTFNKIEKDRGLKELFTIK